MARRKTTPPKTVSRETGQRSLDLPYFLTRYVPPWGNPTDMDANSWRKAVMKQPIAVVCRETIISNLIALDWKIEPRDSTQRDEHKDDIDYYTSFFMNTGKYDYVEILEWVCADLLDIPFGAAVELGREGDRPEGRVLWVELLDGATLYPTLNADYPVGQKVPQLTNPVYFPAHAINRVYYSARREIEKEGWGMPPPQKIYLALELLNRGDVYYANLLLDTPEAGILDLGDMAKDSAEEWVKSWREMLTGIDPFKIPVLYEHEKNVDWIAFTRSPTELMFDKATLKYASVVTAGYGITLSDIGVTPGSSGGDTLAGTIRQERQTKRTGFARMKKKVKYFFDRMLPDYLEFKFIDVDDEVSVALGRSRLATATAIQTLINTGVLTPEEGRQQFIADGLVSISIPEELPEDAMPRDGYNAERPSTLGRPVAPSSGGWGEVSPRSDAVVRALHNSKTVDDLVILRMAYKTFPTIRKEVEEAMDEEILKDALDIGNWLGWHELFLLGDSYINIPEFSAATIDYAVDQLNTSIPKGFSLFEIDRDEAVEDVLSTIETLSKELNIQDRRKQFIRGEIDDINDDIIYDNEYKLRVEEIVDKFIEDAKLKIKRAVILGIYKFAVYHDSIDDLMESQLGLLTVVRQSIDKTCDILLSDLGDKISDIIQNREEKENAT